MTKLYFPVCRKCGAPRSPAIEMALCQPCYIEYRRAKDRAVKARRREARLANAGPYDGGTHRGERRATLRRAYDRLGVRHLIDQRKGVA